MNNVVRRLEQLLPWMWERDRVILANLCQECPSHGWLTLIPVNLVTR